MQRQHIAVLFTDMVDSTAVATSMAPDDADELRRHHFALLRRAIASTEGEEVKNLGDGVMVAFHSASAALACAIQMQQAIDADNRDRPFSIGLRVGLSGGEVSVEDGDYFGDPVIEAARVCARCGPGQILATDVVRLTAGRHGGHVYESLGEVVLKGLPYAVEVVEVAWVPDIAASALELPRRVAQLPAVGFVGRAPELAMIDEHRSRIAANGGCQVVAVYAEPGQGKTTLATAAARQAHDNGALVLFGRADEHVGAPYQLFSELLGHYVKHAPEEQLVAAIGTHASDLARLVPAVATRFKGLAPSVASDADSERYLMFAAVVATFVELSRTQPVFVVLDDLQWADQSSLRMLAHLATAAQPMRVLVVATCRDEELSSSHPLVETIAALHRQDSITRLDLPGLSRDEVVSLMDAAGGLVGPDSADLADDIHRDTDGNAFFVTELMRHLAEVAPTPDSEAPPGTSETGAPTSGTLPRSIHEVISTRVGRLGADDERILRSAAVMGREFDLVMLGRLTACSEHALLDAMDRASSAGLVREVSHLPGQFRFQHALIQRTLRDGLGATRRASIHRQVALAIEEAGPRERERRMGELARHWSLTGRADDLAHAVEYSRRAAEMALESLAPDVALQHYTEAVALRTRILEADLEADLDLQIGLGIAQRKTGSAAYRETLLAACRQAVGLGDTRRLLQAALSNSRGWSSALGAIDDERVEMLEKALQQIPADSTDRALVLAALCKELSWGTTLDHREELAAEAAAIARTCTDDAIAVRVLNDLALPLGTPHTLASSLERTAESLERAERLGDPLLQYFAAMWRAQTLQLAGDVEGRDAQTELSGAMADRLGEPTLLWSQMHNTALQAMSRGDIARADDLSIRALEFGGSIGEPDADTYFGIEQMLINQQRGTLGDLTALIEETIQSMPELGDAGRAALMMSHLEGGRHDAALRLLHQAGSNGFEFRIDNSWVVVVVDHAEVAIEHRQVDQARQIRELLLPFADLIASSGLTSQGPVAMYLGGLATVLSLHDEAEHCFAKADTVNRQMGDRFSAARTALWWGRLSVDRGQADIARERVVAACSIAEENGYAGVARRAHEALATSS